MTSLADFVSVTRPASCALALALPLDWDEFVGDGAASPEKDYVRSMLRGRPPEEVWAEDGFIFFVIRKWSLS